MLALLLLCVCVLTCVLCVCVLCVHVPCSCVHVFVCCCVLCVSVYGPGARRVTCSVCASRRVSPSAPPDRAEAAAERGGEGERAGDAFDATGKHRRRQGAVPIARPMYARHTDWMGLRLVSCGQVSGFVFVLCVWPN